ncbi:HAH_0734 family protein [Halovivax sp.]|uniref:HAH_0734 family protein n=1 Tax=Halovivax sp. TaxID=1935978 RepID=UPI0025BEEE10|nr:HAH_0734 family protein [Halovivax sp.]
MKKLIIHGDPGIRKGAVIEVDGERLVCFSINRNGEWHGPERVQLWCTVGTDSEREDFELRNYVPHFLDVELVDAEDVTVVEARERAA